MKNQTAVGWLVEQIKQDQNKKALSEMEWIKVIEQAKAMEKEQIINAWIDSAEHPFDCYAFAEQYYKETYK